MLLSLPWLIWRSSHPSIPALGRMPDGKAYPNTENYPEAVAQPGILILRFHGPLFFATAASLRTRIQTLIAGAETAFQTVILDMESTYIIDLESMEALKEIAKELKEM